MNIALDLQFLNIHNPFSNERISAYLDKHRRTSSDTKDFFVKQISHLAKNVAIASISVVLKLTSFVNKIHVHATLKNSTSF